MESTRDPAAECYRLVDLAAGARPGEAGFGRGANSPAVSGGDIDDLLHRLRSEGKVDSEGRFTLATEEAWRKLAVSQLPSSGAWILKVVQAVVASGSRHPLRVEQTREATEVHFGPGRPWDLSLIADGLGAASAMPQSDMAHLLVALRAVVAAGRSVTLRGPQGGLVWDGERAVVRRWSETADRFLLVVGPSPNLSKSRAEWRAEQADIASCLTTRAFTCPLPLTLAGKRLDALQFCPRNGYRGSSFLLDVGFVSEPRQKRPALPRFPPPPGTYEALSEPGGRSRRGSATRRPARPRDEAGPHLVSLAYLLTYHSRRKDAWQPASRVPEAQESLACWLGDGVVLAVEPLPLAASPVSASFFVSAEGLGTDLTTLNLLEDPERERRLRRAVALALPRFQGLAQASTLAEHGKGSEHSRIWLGMGSALFGSVALLSLMALKPTGVLLGTVGLMKMKDGLSKPTGLTQAEGETIRDEMGRQVASWEAFSGVSMIDEAGIGDRTGKAFSSPGCYND